MKITFLGTGTSQGVPVVGCNCPVCTSEDEKNKRFRCSVCITTDDGKNILIDTSPDLRQQLLNNKIFHLDALLYTHEHSDHTAGIDDVRPINFMMRQDIPAFAMPRVVNDLNQRFDYIFGGKNYPGIPMVTLDPIDEPFKTGNIEIIPIALQHGELPIFGYRIGNIAYLTDVKTIPEESFQFLDNLEILVLNALRNEAHHSHMTLDEAIATADKIQAKQTYFTHISHRLGLHAEVENKLPSNYKLAFDTLSCETMQ